MLRYKDLRMLYISIAIIIICLASMFYFLYDKIKFIIILFLFITILPTLLLRFNAKIFDDAMMVYVFKGIGVLPELIDFDDVRDYKKISQHKIIINHKKTSKICIVDANAFMQEFEQKYSQFKIQQKHELK